MENKEEILIGSLYELVLIGRNEEEQHAEFMKIGKYWNDKGYNIASGKVNEGKVDELWAIRKPIQDLIFNTIVNAPVMPDIKPIDEDELIN